MGLLKGLFDVEISLFGSDEKLSEGLTYRLRDELSFAHFPQEHIESQTLVGAFFAAACSLTFLHVNEWKMFQLLIKRLFNFKKASFSKLPVNEPEKSRRLY